MLFSKEEEMRIDAISFQKIYKILDLEELIIIDKLILRQMSHTEVAKAMHLSRKAYYKKKNRMLNKIKKHLAKEEIC